MKSIHELLDRVATKEAAKAELAKDGKTIEDLKVAGDAARINNPDLIIDFVETLTGKTVNPDGSRNAFNYSLAVVSVSCVLAKLLVRDSLVVHPEDVYKACDRIAGSIEVCAEQLHTHAQDMMAESLKDMNPVDFIKRVLGINIPDQPPA